MRDRYAGDGARDETQRKGRRTRKGRREERSKREKILRTTVKAL